MTQDGTARDGSSTAPEEMRQLAGKYLTFALAGEAYGIQILKVQEIMGMQDVTAVPRTPDYVRGVINLRGKVIPVVDLRLKFGLESTEDTARTCIIVLQVETGQGPITTGIIVDEVSEVLNIDAGHLEPTPSLGAGLKVDYIMAMGKVGEQVVMLLDVDKALSGSEAGMVHAAEGGAA